MSLADERRRAAVTGGSALTAIGRVGEHALQGDSILGIVDREEGGREREVIEEEAPLVTLFRRSDFL